VTGNRVERARRDESGSVTVLMAVAVVVAGLLCYGVARVGVAAVLRTRAENAADAAALAAADRLALGEGSQAARAAADATARDNMARLVECDCTGGAAEVVVELDVGVPIPGFPPVQARARAEIDLGISR